MTNPMLKSTMVLTLVCLVAATLLGLAYNATAEKIEEQQITALKENLNQVFPEADRFIEEDDYHIAYRNNKVIGFAAVSKSYGYSSLLKILVGMDLNKTITSIRILDQVETPGLGANLEKPEFYEQFNGLTEEEIALRQDGGKIDAITSATVTSSGVIAGVKNIIISKLTKLVDAKTGNEAKNG